MVRPVRQTRTAIFLLAPSLLFLILFTYWPVVQVVARSLVVRDGWGLGNYRRLFGDPHFRNAAANNFVFAVGTIVPSLALALAFALALREHSRVTAVLRTILVFPLLIPLVAAAALFVFILLPGEGLIDHWFGWLGLRETNWLGDPSLALGAIIAITVWKNVGYYMLFFLAGLAGIPEELHEAARLEGASAHQRFVHITWPLLRPTLAFVVVIALLNVMTQVDHIVIMTQGGPSDATNVLLYYIYQQAQQNNDPGLAAGATVVTVSVLLAISMTSLRALERGMHAEG